MTLVAYGLNFNTTPLLFTYFFPSAILLSITWFMLFPSVTILSPLISWTSATN